MMSIVTLTHEIRSAMDLFSPIELTGLLVMLSAIPIFIAGGIIRTVWRYRHLRNILKRQDNSSLKN